MSVTRRRLLEGFGTTGMLLASAGCLGRSETATTDTPTSTEIQAGTDTDNRTDARTATPSSGTPTTSSDRDRRVSMGQTVTAGDTRITVTNPRVRKAVVTSGMAHTRVVAQDGQFVVVDVLIDGNSPEETADLDLRSSVDGERRSGSDPLASLEGEASSFAFGFPAGRHAAAAILHTADGSCIYWTLPTAIRERLALEPEFAIPSLEVPNNDGELTLDMSVANEGERDGIFRARVSLTGYSGGSVVEFPVPAGESRTYTGRPGDILLYLENRDGGTLTLEYPADEGLASIERSVALPRTATESNPSPSGRPVPRRNGSVREGSTGQ